VSVVELVAQWPAAAPSLLELADGDRLPDGIALRHTDPGPSTLCRSAAVRWLATGEGLSIAATLEALADFLVRYVIRRDRRTALWLAVPSRVPDLPLPVDPLGREALRQEPASRPSRQGLLHRLAGHGPPDQGPALLSAATPY
jgi:hypothetical protein